MIITQETYLRRREALFAKMVPGSAALIFAAPEVIRSRDTEYQFRQNSDFWYLTGFNEPEALLIMIKSAENHYHSVLFNRTRDPRAEVWHGRRLGQEAALSQLAVDRALPWEAINQDLPLLLNGLEQIYHAAEEYAFADQYVATALNKLRQGSRQNLRAPITQTDWRPWVHEMRLFKDPEEIMILSEAGKISALAHQRAMTQCRPGMWEYQLEGEILHEFSQHGARFASYNTIIGGGVNGCILHYTENESQLQDGDLVLIDAGCELHGYAADITRTFPINGKFSPAQREIYQLVLEALQAALAMFKPGVSIGIVNQRVVEILVEGLVRLGILQGEVDQLIEDHAYRQFFMHGLGHWLGLDVHDVGDYGSSARDRILAPGMVLTVEPGLYISEDAAVPAQYRGIGIRIEDDILITQQGHKNLTDSVPKDPDQIEALMAAAR